MENTSITQVFVEDYKSIQSIGRETFYETFASSNAEADIQEYILESFSDTKVIQELSDEDSLFYIAWENELQIGYLKINIGSAQTELQDPLALEIERIYVKATHQGKRIGQLLYDQAIEIAKLKNKKVIWLGVWENNVRAIKFYEKNGFVPFDKHLFMMGKDEQTDIMMRKVVY